MKNIKYLSLRIDKELLSKFHYICKYEGRSANSQILIYIRKAIKNFEKTYGEIKFDDKLD